MLVLLLHATYHLTYNVPMKVLTYTKLEGTYKIVYFVLVFGNGNAKAVEIYLQKFSTELCLL